MLQAIIGSLVLVICGGIGTVFWSHLSDTKENAKHAHSKAHHLETKQLEQRATHAEEMRRLEVMLMQQQVDAHALFVRKTDHDAITAEVFRKLESQDRQTVSAFSELRTWLNTKFDSLATQLNTKQDKHQ